MYRAFEACHGRTGGVFGRSAQNYRKIESKNKKNKGKLLSI
jgi:hypothetical protein